MVRGDLSEKVVQGMPILLGVGSALLLLIETNMVLLVAALSIVSIFLAAPPRLLRLIYYALSALIAVVLFWLAAGQSLSNLGSYLHGSLEITSGYTAALSIESSPIWHYDLAFLMVILVLIIIVNASPERTLQLTWAPLVLVAIYLFLTFKETFVVHGPGHQVIAFVACLVSLLAIPVKPKARLPLIGALIFAVVAIVVVNGVGPTSSALRHGMATSVRIPQLVVSSSSRAASMKTVRRQIHQDYFPGLGLSPSTVALAGGKATYIDSGQAGVSWAYPSLKWAPLPVLQDYSASTPYLDQLNANYLASPDGPQRILRQPSSGFDGVVPAFQSPAAVVSMICHYGQLGSSLSWQVLGKTATDRCGPMKKLSTVESGIGQTIKVPKLSQSDQAVVAIFGKIPSSWTAAPLSVLFKGASVKIAINKSANLNRFIAATAGQPHLMIEPRDLGYSCRFSFRPIHAFSITGGGASPAKTGLTVTFYSVHVTPAGADPGCPRVNPRA
jgi:hypothetical protein